MDNMRTRFVIAVTGRLSAAADTTAKVELIEELSENLYNRWQDLVGNGMDPTEAFNTAMDDLGNVDELLAYLDSLGPDGELPRQESGPKDFTSDLLKGVEGIVRETVHQTRDAVDQASVIVKNVAEKLKEKYPDGFKGKVYVHFDRDEEGGRTHRAEAGEAEIDAEAARAEAEEARIDAEAARAEAEAVRSDAKAAEKGWSFSLGYNRDRGGFFCESGRPSRKVEGRAFASQDLKGIDVQIINGDVTVRIDPDASADVQLDGDLENLELRISDDGVLSVRQGNTAASSFFFFRGLAAADVEITLPRRFWDFVQVSAVNGDVDVDVGLEVGQLSVKTTSGDAQVNGVDCQELIFHSASGDLDAGDISSNSVVAETASGDVQLTGGFRSVRIGTASGDVDLTGAAETLQCSSASGDLNADLKQVPQSLDLHSKSGDCEIVMPDGEGFTLQFSTVSGELDSDFALVGPIGKRSGEAIYLDGGGRTFRMSSVSGDISLRQQ